MARSTEGRAANTFSFETPPAAANSPHWLCGSDFTSQLFMRNRSPTPRDRADDYVTRPGGFRTLDNLLKELRPISDLSARQRSRGLRLESRTDGIAQSIFGDAPVMPQEGMRVGQYQLRH